MSALPSRFGEVAGRATPASWRLTALLGAAVVLRLAAAWEIPLTEDEAYYRLWAGHLQAGYYDHPPMIAWWIRVGTLVAGDGPLGVRLLPALASVAVTAVVYDLARRLGGERATAERAAVWYNAALLIGVGGQMATPDAPATLFWAITLACLVRVGERPAWWGAAGLAAGLACLSKYSALFLGPGVLLWLASSGQGRRWLARPWPWIAAAVAGAVFAVNVVWNAEHGWLSFAKQFGRVAPEGFAPAHLLEFLSVQFVLLNPLLAIYAAPGLLKAWREREAAQPNLFLVVATGAPFAAYLLLHALHDRVQAHWPAPLYPGLALCAAFAAAAREPGRRERALRIGGAAAGLVLAALAAAHMAWPATDVFGPGEPALAMRDWPGFASRLAGVADRRDAAWIGTVSYGLAAQLDDQPATGRPVAQLAERARYGPTDRSWRADLSRPGLVVDLSRRLDASDLAECFGSIRPLGRLQRGPEGARNGDYAVFLVSRPLKDVLDQGCWTSKRKDAG